MFQNSAQGFTHTWHPAELVLSIRSNIKRYHSLRRGGIRGYLEGPAGWEPGVRQGSPNPDTGELGKDQTGTWQFPIQWRGWAQSGPDQRFYRDIVGWKHVSHANVVPFLGISETLLSFCIISLWLPGGNILEYIRKHRGANRLRLVSDQHDLRK